MAVPQGVPRIVVVVAAAADRLLAGEFVELLGGARVRAAPAARRESDCGHYRQADLDGSLHRVYRTATRNHRWRRDARTAKLLRASGGAIPPNDMESTARRTPAALP